MVLRKHIKKFFKIRSSRPLFNVDGTESCIVEMGKYMNLKRMVFRYIGDDNKILSYFESLSDMKAYLKGDKRLKNSRGIKNLLWFPQHYGIGTETTKKRLRSIHALVVDVDSKVCETKEEFVELSQKLLGENGDDSVWETIGLPKPTFVVFSGSGLHLYWALSKPLKLYMDKTLFGRAEKVHNLFIERLSTYYGGQLDTIPITQGFRVPGSISKTGKKVLTYKIHGGFHGTLEEIESVVYGSSSLFQNGGETEDEFDSDSELNLTAASEAVEIESTNFDSPKTSTERVRRYRRKHGYRNSRYLPIAKSEIRGMDQRTYISGIFKVLDSNIEERNKSRFVGKVISLVAKDGLIPVGTRNMRLFAVTISMVKAKASETLIMDVIHSINTLLCDSPLSVSEIRRMIKSAGKYVKMTWDKMKKFIFFGSKNELAFA